MKITFYGTRDYDHLYFDVLAADPEYGCDIRFLAANLDKDTAPLAAGGEAVCAFVNADGSAQVLETLAAVGVKLLLLRCAGFNNVDLDAAKRCGITVLRVPGYSPEAVAEHAMALAMAANRRICKAYIKVRNNNFALDGLLGHTLYGSAAGIVGTGRIGAAMARICCGFGMTVLAYDQYRNPALEGLVRYVGLEELLRTADLVPTHRDLIEAWRPAPLEVAAAMLTRGQTVLLCRHPEGKARALQWEFPGGKLEPGETAGAGARMPRGARRRGPRRAARGRAGVRLSGPQRPSDALSGQAAHRAARTGAQRAGMGCAVQAGAI